MGCWDEVQAGVPPSQSQPQKTQDRRKTLIFSGPVCSVSGRKLPDSQASLPFVDPAARLFPKPFLTGGLRQNPAWQPQGHCLWGSPRYMALHCQFQRAMSQHDGPKVPIRSYCVLNLALPAAPWLPVPSYNRLSNHFVAVALLQPLCSRLTGSHTTLDVRFLLVTLKCKSTAHISLWTYSLPPLGAHSTSLLEVQETVWDPHPTQIPDISPPSMLLYTPLFSEYGRHHDFSTDLDRTFRLILHI